MQLHINDITWYHIYYLINENTVGPVWPILGPGWPILRPGWLGAGMTWGRVDLYRINVPIHCIRDHLIIYGIHTITMAQLSWSSYDKTDHKQLIKVMSIIRYKISRFPRTQQHLIISVNLPRAAWVNILFLWNAPPVNTFWQLVIPKYCLITVSRLTIHVLMEADILSE
jgi:hypothetical protein